jgi:hypothetical protein
VPDDLESTPLALQARATARPRTTAAFNNLAYGSDVTLGGAEKGIFHARSARRATPSARPRPASRPMQLSERAAYVTVSLQETEPTTAPPTPAAPRAGAKPANTLRRISNFPRIWREPPVLYTRINNGRPARWAGPLLLKAPGDASCRAVLQPATNVTQLNNYVAKNVLSRHNCHAT